MALEKRERVELQVDDNETVTVITFSEIYEDGNLIAKTKHRQPVQPGEDYSGLPPKARMVIARVHTPTAVAKKQAYDEYKFAQDMPDNGGNPTPLNDLKANYEAKRAAHEQFISDNF